MSKHPNYELFEEIGRGENSVVYRAWDLLLNRDVAIKELTAEPGSDGGVADQERISQFLKEASFLAQFEHENVLRIHTVDRDRGWIVMELMQGALTNQISSKPMQPDTVRSVLKQILGALAFLHAKDKVHGSVRPSNILINEQGTVKLSDFEASSRDGELRVPKNSKKYLAPELIRSDFGEFGPAVDLYCLGFTALELLTATKFNSLFLGTGEGAIDADVAWLRWHSSDEPLRPVSELAPNVPSDLANVIDQLLQKNVDQRPSSAAEVLKLLDDVPLVPVDVLPAPSKTVKQQDLASILPSTAVKLRKGGPRAKQKTRTQSKSSKKQSAVALSGREKLNDTLGKPYVLWPICIGMLLVALFIGLSFQAGRNVEPPPIAGIGKPDAVIEAPETFVVELNVFPDSENATLTVAGERREFAELALESGQYEIVVEKTGYQPFETLLEVAPEHTAFDIVLEAVEAVAVTPEKNTIPEPETGPSPIMVTVSIEVVPEHAQLYANGQAVDLIDGTIQLNPNEMSELQLSAQANGYEAATGRWSMVDIADNEYRLKLTLDKLPAVVTGPKIKLPDSLAPKSETEFDPSTGLPLRAIVKSLDDESPLELALVVAGNYRFGVIDGPLRTWELSAKAFEVKQPFYIGVNEVTVSQFRTFADAIGDRGDLIDASVPQSQLPVTGLNIRQAAEFCDWAGGRLPTEREWEAAVRGVEDSGYPLPWSSDRDDRDLSPSHCNLFRGESDENNRLTNTGSLPAGANPIGLLNTIGNAAEWCDNQLDAERFVIKGCSYRIPPGKHVRVSWRNRAKWKGAADIGIRLLVPVVAESTISSALAFTAPTNIDSLLVTSEVDNQQPTEQVYTKTIEEIADQFTGNAELVIDSGGFIDEITDVSFSPDGKMVAVAGGKIVRLWDVDRGQLQETLRGDMSRTSYGNVNAVAWSPDGKFLLVGVNDYREHGNIRVYSTDNFDEVKEVIVGHEAPCRKLAFSRDGRHLVSVDSDGLILVTDWATRQIQHRIPARDRDEPIFDVLKFPADAPFLIGVDFEGPQIYSILDGTRLGAQDDMPSSVRGWLVDIYNKLVPFPFGVKAEPRVMDFQLENGRWAGAGNAVVEGRSRFWVRVWESRDPVSSATPAKELGGYDKHRWNVTAISMQPGGSLVASGDKFGEVHVWDSKTGERKFKFAGQGKPIYEVAFDSSSNRLAFGTRPHAPKDWGRNSHGDATQVLDLRQRAIAGMAAHPDLQPQHEQPERGQSKVNVKKQGAYHLIERLLGSQVQSKYRISSGRNPTALTMLAEPKLDVQQPVVFGDNEGLLALWDSAGDELKRAFIGHDNLVSAITQSRNGKLIATSSTDRTIRLWSLEDYVPTGTFDFKFENSVVRAVTPGSTSAAAGVAAGDKIVSIDGLSLTEMFELMLTGDFEYKPGQMVPVKMSRDDQPFEYKMKMAPGYDFAEPVLNFYMGDNGQWVIWHPQGYYDASPGADRLIGWHLNRGYNKSARFFEVQQFRQKLYRPDVIDGILETGSLKLALAKLNGGAKERQEVDFREPAVIAEHHPPAVRITSPADRWETDDNTVAVTGEARSVNGSPLTALTLLHNGSVAKVFRPTGVNQLSMTIEHEMQLHPGLNDLVLIATDTQTTSGGEHIVVNWNQTDTGFRANAVVLAIGVSDFDDDLGQLPHAAVDATAFAEQMKAYQNGKLYSDVKVKTLSKDVTDSDVLDGFSWLADNTNVGDVAMVFIASRAIVDRRDNFYIATTNSRAGKARSSAVSWRDLVDTLQLDLPDCKRMVFLDLQPTDDSIRPGLRNPLLDLAAAEMGTIFLSANSLQQKPIDEAANGAGTFLQAVISTVGDKKFDTSPTTGDSFFNPVELATGVISRVRDQTGDRQRPIFFTPEFAKLGNVFELRN